MSVEDPHRDSRLVEAGTALEGASAVVILIHGRGDSPEGILSLAPAIDPGGVGFVAPAAVSNVWYPQSFMAPLDANQPWLDSALARVGALIEHLAEIGIEKERLMLLGFSQGACLALETAARRADRFGAVVGLSGGLIGPELEAARYDGDFEGTPIFIGCSDIDPHIPLERVQESAELLRSLNADVDERIYPGMGHMVNEDEIETVSAMLTRIAAS